MVNENTECKARRPVEVLDSIARVQRAAGDTWLSHQEMAEDRVRARAEIQEICWIERAGSRAI